ncbi:hypothetical protein Pse7429DRAFT_0378 [Pseudanabaena biceps PCC 7429]|uniref:Uncharacterized protein n=1 Tax=Pseudanabaena biceps PCC 7429 TaxID=927668 RepID=L8N6J5_9CYAN|nr:hypothetical protein Pse7429DRAFT_0378 [Pseudanabaena biceps PCC 7429]
MSYHETVLHLANARYKIAIALATIRKLGVADLDLK